MSEPTRTSLPFAPIAGDKYEKALMGFCQEAIQEGDAYLKAQRGYEKIAESIQTIMGTDENVRATPLSRTTSNHVGKIALDLRSMLTDTKPFWEYRTPAGSRFEKTGTNLGKLSQHWYLNSQADMRQGDVISYALAAGCGYPHLTWDARKLDISCDAEDPRDVLPISPVDNFSLQSALGAAVRRERTLWWVKSRYGIEVPADRDGTATMGGGQQGRAMRLLEKLGGSPFWELLTKSKPAREMPRLPTVDVYTLYLHDDRLNEKRYPVEIGQFQKDGTPLNNWSYVVEPGQPLYPRGRMIEFCKTYPKPLYDGPNPYWHGMIPLPKLILDPWPWSWLGKAPLWDILPLQKTLTKLLRVVDDQVEKIARPDLVADKNSISEGALNKIDTRRAGLKIRYNAMAGKGVEIAKGAPIDASIMQMINFVIQQMDVISGTSDTSQLMGLNQLPSDDSIGRIMEAMTRSVRARSRSIEAYIREFATMLAFNFFQFYTEPMLMATLGPNAVTPEWFDFDPHTFLPDFIHGNDFDNRGIVTDKAMERGPLPRMDRAQEFMRHMSFYVAPSSLLAASEIERKLLYLQLSRAGLVDHWTLLETLGIPNVGDAPAGTITDRLAAERNMGIGMAANAAGRKASGQKMPRTATKES
ncbi:MAG TPA: hypothetical protein VJQ59_17010 [Candidatus Sulfotelmatobacter sp.]|nr:hypothetical protein [Candidatus Sulfotelmatobacter sp.]